MSGKRRHTEREVGRVALVQQAKSAALARGVAVEVSALAPHNSYGQPEYVERGYYIDIPFACRVCGIPQTWTAAQQKWWYEVAKGYVYSTATRCRPCRQGERARREAARLGLKGGDLNPSRNPGLLLTRIRAAIEPKLLSLGYGSAGGKRPRSRRVLHLDYRRSDDLIALSWDPHLSRLMAELLTDGGDSVQSMTTTVFSDLRSMTDLEDRLAPFLDSVKRIVNGLESPIPEPGPSADPAVPHHSHDD